MSAQKQRRILSRGIGVLVAILGRLRDILQEIENLRFLGLDEADRVIETGHFAELDNIRLTSRKNEGVGGEAEDTKEGIKAGDLQTFVFSATLSEDVQKNLKRRSRIQRKNNEKPASTLDDLLLRLDFRDPEPAVVDTSSVGSVVATLKESRIECLANQEMPIDGIRRLLPLLELLNIAAFLLYSQLEQRQRLKNLDRFKSTPNLVLLATDIPAVDHVVQYPRTADVYVHRNGKTARAMRRGFSLLMCAPDERRLIWALMHSWGREEGEIVEMTVELYMLDKLKARSQLAREIDVADDDSGPSNQQCKAVAAKVAGLKAELKGMLAQPLVARGVSTGDSIGSRGVCVVHCKANVDMLISQRAVLDDVTVVDSQFFSFSLDGNNGVHHSIYPIITSLHDARHTAWLALIPPSRACSRVIASCPVEYKPTWWHPTFASRTAQAPAAPSKPSQLDAGRQRARCIARLSLPLCAPVSNVFDLDRNGFWT
ncbi:P-loop containing nucleoside triphosphate hydrolase protein [Fomes fomentarius]|nr:P-loop containing nucleoside triphosphate hydrolase protein [Fomes fomentarius]